ncbi:neutral zinc metallopeptidase [Pseudonocardia spinosispora]|uniref:neutral zinc metallopeptidase n=1 Tax=Pseudonocardia spinosispora TaxID=103441 RepID=UPI0012EC9B4E|nr:neutral zinc metallopeptidase [Pseudonocardia spinosispora]
MTAPVRIFLAVLAAFGLAASPLLSGTAWAAPRPVPNSMADDEQTAVEVVNGFWTRHFQEYFGGSYSPPRVVGAYVGSRGPRCGGIRSMAGNAFYCRPGDYLAWDEQLMSAGYSKIGDSWVYVIIAHEWGHAIQARLKRTMVSQDGELQADCLAGATLNGAAHDGTLIVEPNDREELEGALVAVADKYKWSSSKDHGNAQQRVSAYNKGALGGVKACFQPATAPRS